METPLDILMKATHYVENQQSTSLSNVSRPSNTNPAANEERPIKENGHADRIASPYLKAGAPPQEVVSQHFLLNKQQSLRRSSAQDESGIDRKRESMRFAEVSSSDETANMSQYHRNGILQRMYGVDDKIASAYQATDSPLKSSPRKRSSSPSSRAETEQPAKMHMPQQLNHLVASATQSVGQLPAANPMIPFIHPLYSMDPTMYADALTRQAIANSDAARPGASPASTSTTQAVNDAITSQGLSRLMYPVQNSALLMAQRAPTATGFAIPEIPMVVPSQLAAAYGQTGGLLPQQLAAWSAGAPDAEKRMMESMLAAGLSPQHLQAQWLANPYFKSIFAAQNSELAASSKDSSRSVPKPTVPTAAGLTTLPNYSAEFFLKYPEALNAELLKQHDRTLASQSMSPRVSPENAKKPGIPAHHPASVGLPVPPEVLTAASLPKSSLMDWKIPASTARGMKHDGGQLGFEARPSMSTSRRDPVYSENHAEIQSKVAAEEARHKLAAGLTQRPGAGNDAYAAARYNSHERQSPSPFAADRWDNYRRRSRDFSPHLSPNAGDKAAKKRPHEVYGIPRDLIPPELKTQSPSAQATIGGLRQTKSPQRATRSPMEHPTVHSAASGLFASLAGKPTPTAADKDNPALYPYMLHPAFSGYPLPFALPTAASYLCQPDIGASGQSKAMADALTVAAAAQASAAVGSPLFRAQLPQESALTADLAVRWPTISPYVQLLQQQQQQQQVLKAFSTTTSNADYAAAIKFQQSLLDGRDKERVDSPSHPALASARRYMPTSNMSPAPKPSPVLAQSKPNIKNPTQGLNHLYKPRAASPVRAPDGLDARTIKRETSPLGVKRTLPSAISPHGFARSSASNIRLVEEERNRLKRKAMEDPSDRNFAKESSLKRKRELTTANDVDEHFRRSLGGDYKESDGPNKIHITGSVDDHFQKALGTDVWSKLKTTKASGSPAVTDPLPNGRDPRSIPPAGLHSGLPPYPPYFASMHGAPPPDSRNLTSLSYPVHPMMIPGSRTVKSGATVYPELKTDTSVASVPSTSGHSEVRSEASKRIAAFPEPRAQPPPPAYEAAARRQNDSQETASIRRSSTSPIEKQARKPNFSQNSSPRSNSSQNSGERPTVSECVHPGTTAPPHAQSAHTITNGFSKSPTRLPPAYSPPSSSSASSLPVTSSPAHPVSVDRQPSEESNKTAPTMSVQS